MRKVILFNMMTLDGFFEGADHDISWHHVDAEFNEFATEQLDSAGGLLFGRVTYVMMASYWPTPAALADDPEVAAKMNSMPKVVFSRTLDRADWDNTVLVRGSAAAEVAQLREQPGKDLLVFGSAVLASTLIREGLIDEFRIMVNPVVIGQGTPLFQGIPDKVDLRLLKARTFGNGNVLLYNEPGYRRQ
jgi:dihydrofolate reductase